jgi:ADP-heptose:LPS heptosyltransferase
MTRKKVFSIDGGAGRAICAIPALEKYARLHSDEDWNIIIGGWDTLYFGNPLLQERTYSMDVKGIFKNLIKDSQIIHPEPYTLWQYYNQQCSLAEAFDKEINETDDHSDLGKPNLYLCKAEEKNAANMLASVKAKQSKDLTIVIQPFGRSARVDNGDIIDDSTRSIEPRVYQQLVKKLSQKYNIILMAEPDFVNLVSQDDQISEKPQGVDLRFWTAVIESADYFIGCDSVGQHMARAFDVPGTVIMGSTYASNVSYPDYFNMIENKNIEKVYSPIRVAGFDCHLSDRLNDGLMDFSEDEVDEIYKSIVKDIKEKV